MEKKGSRERGRNKTADRVRGNNKDNYRQPRSKAKAVDERNTKRDNAVQREFAHSVVKQLKKEGKGRVDDDDDDDDDDNLLFNRFRPRQRSTQSDPLVGRC